MLIPKSSCVTYHVLSLWIKHHFLPYFWPDMKTEMGVVIYIYLNIPQNRLISNIHGFMGLPP